MSRTCVIYARISKSNEESVSVERQLEAGRAYAAARGWTVVGEHVDDGVSAFHNKPEDRDGWKALLASSTPFDAVVCWKVDRLTRRVLDFLHADEALQSRGAALVCVEDPIDMSTATGRAFATMLAVFAELEAEAIRARVKAARNHMIRSSRYVGGTLPFGYRAVPNPDGAGWIVAQDPEQIRWVREMVDRTLAGKTIYSTMRWLADNNVPTTTWRVPFVWRDWAYSSLDSLMRHPLLAGCIPYNPGHVSKTRGEELLRDENGLPVVDESLAVMSLDEWRRMQAKLALAASDTNRRAPRATRRKTSGVLSGLVWCGEHDEPVRMWRGTTGPKSRPRHGHYCATCHQTLSSADDLIIRHVLAYVGDLPHVTAVEEVIDGGSVQEREAELRRADLGREMGEGATKERRAEINAELDRLDDIIAEARSRPSEVRLVWDPNPRTFAEDWELAEDDDERRAILGHALDRVIVRRGGRGQRSDANKLARCTFEWRAGQVETPTDAELAAWADEDPAAS